MHDELQDVDAILFFDGAARDNHLPDKPSRAGAGAILKRPDGTVWFADKRYLEDATSNVAEYHALIMGLERATDCRIKRIEVRGDSELVVNQMTGVYKVRAAKLRLLHERARELRARFAWFRISHIPREQNVDADHLANEAIDEASSAV